MKCKHQNNEKCLLNLALQDGSMADATQCSLCQLSLEALENEANQVGASLREQAASSGDVFVRPPETTQLAPNGGHQIQSDGVSASQSLGDYRIIREIGRGGMGVVYEAEQLSLGRRVALKLLPNSLLHGPRTAARFQREAEAAASLHHTNIVPIYDSGKFDDGSFFYAMQLIRGHSLNEVREALKLSRSQAQRDTDEEPETQATVPVALTGNFGSRPVAGKASPPGKALANTGQDTERPWSKTETGAPEDFSRNIKTSHRANAATAHYRYVAELGCQVASALQHAHERGIIHRDVKPANLIVDDQEVVWLADFGLAKWKDEELTRTTEAPGTLRYMAPERFRGKADPRTDVYSLGATLYELLTLSPVFAANDELTLLECIKNSPPRALRTIDAEIPRDLQTIVMKSLAKEPEHRYETAAALREDLARFLTGREILGRHVSAVERLRMSARRNPGFTMMLAIIVVGSIAVAVTGSLAALQFRQIANDQVRLTEQAEAAVLDEQRTSYYLETNLVSTNLESNTSVVRVRDYLKHWVPKGGEHDFRGWEWFFLDAFAHRERLVCDLNFGQPKPVLAFSLDYSPDGAMLAVPLSNEVLILNSQTGQEVLRLPPNQGLIIALRFSHRGDLLAVTSEDKTLKIWDWKNQRLVHQVEYGNGLGSVSWHPEDDEVAFFSNGFEEADAIQVLDLETQQIRKIFLDGIGHHTRETAYSQDGKYFATSLDLKPGYCIVLFNTETWEVHAKKQLHSRYIYSIAWHPSGESLVSASLDGTVSLWNLQSDESRVLWKSSDGMTSVDWASNGNYVAFAGWDHAVPIWENQAARVCDSLPGHETKLRCLSWNPARQEVASVDWAGQLRIFDFERPAVNGHLVMPVRSNIDQLFLSWKPDGTELAASNAGNSYFWELQPSSLAASIRSTQGLAIPVWSDDGSQLAQRSATQITITNAIDATQNSIELPNIATHLAWDRRGEKLFFTDAKTLFSVPNSLDQAPQKIAGPFLGTYDLQISPDGGQAALAIRDGLTRIVDLQSGKVEQELPVASISSHRATAWSTDGKLLACGGDDQLVEIWETEGWTRVRELTGHSFGITSMAWHPHQPRLATASRDKTVRVWETDTFRTTIVLAMEQEIGNVAWSRDGKKLAAIDKDGRIKIWDASKSYLAAKP